MKNCLLFLAVVAVLMVGAPAYSQYVFLDVNGDGVNSNTNPLLADDVLNNTRTSVDVYFRTDANRDGSAAVCSTSPDPFSIISYEFTLHASGSGSVSYGTWTDNMGFTVTLTPCGPSPCSAGPDIWVAKGSGVAQAPGQYKVGTLAITVTGTPILSIVPGSAALNPVSQTSFGSACLGSAFDNTIRLGPLGDFADNDGTEPTTAVFPKTWGQIKDLYK